MNAPSPPFLVQARQQVLPPGYGLVSPVQDVLVQLLEEDGSVLSLLEPSVASVLTLLEAPGGSGSGGGGSIATYMAASILGGQRAVKAVAGSGKAVAYADATDVSGCGFAVLGLTVADAVANGSVRVQLSGEMTETSWNWTVGPVWLGLQGQLTQTRPTSGLEVLIGFATSPTTLNIDVSDTVAFGD